MKKSIVLTFLMQARLLSMSKDGFSKDGGKMIPMDQTSKVLVM